MHRYIAPAHVTQIFAPSGVINVADDHTVSFESDVPFPVHHALVNAGCVLAPAVAEEPAKASPSRPIKGAAAEAAEAPATGEAEEAKD